MSVTVQPENNEHGNKELSPSSATTTSSSNSNSGSSDSSNDGEVISKSHSVAPENSQGQRSSSFCRPCRLLVLLAVAIGSAGIAMGVILPRESGDKEFDLLDPSTWIPGSWLDSNPHGGNTPYDFSLWETRSRCKGLQLRIVNNLESKWQGHFETAIDDWENGSPDALSLEVRNIPSYDAECSPLDGVMKVCNGDYGDTQWLGLNNVMIQFDYIISSVALMNDYYLLDMGFAAMQNTMCHELGHGFGLGHWDENFYNKDLGNCMDYTVSPENNQHPADTNFEFLEFMYGNAQGSSLYVAEGVNGTEKLHCTSTVGSDAGTIQSVFNGNLRHGRHLTQNTRHRPNLSQEQFSHYATFLTSQPLVTADKTTSEHPLAHLGWRYLKRTNYGEVHERDLGHGIKILSHVKLA